MTSKRRVGGILGEVAERPPDQNYNPNKAKGKEGDPVAGGLRANRRRWGWGFACSSMRMVFFRHDKGRKNINSRFVSSRMGDFDGMCGMAWRLRLCCSEEPASGIGRNPASCFTEWGCGVGGDACGGSGIAAALCGCHVGARFGVGGCADSAGEFGVVRRRDGGAWRRH